MPLSTAETEALRPTDFPQSLITPPTAAQMVEFVNFSESIGWPV